MDLGAFRSLLAPAGQQVLQAAAALEPREVNFLPHFQALRRSYPEELARAALAIAILRTEGRTKFPFADKMYFTREALEQASAWEVATYRAGRYGGFDLVLDLGCSLGGDTLALARAATTLGIDRDPLRLSMARANLASLGLEHRAFLLQADLSQPLSLGGLSGEVGLFFDPARRAGGRRIYSVRAYRPPLEIVRQWMPDFPALGAKISPGVRLEELGGYDAEVEFISQRGELKEAMLWFGPLKSAERRATVLPGPHTMTGSGEQPPPALSEPLDWLYEPDPAVLRAGLVRALGEKLGAAQLDADIAYLTAAEGV
ncbi:MAG TPA: class I SAM-dependent methyltransferase, partial [Anaerolineales bacterium]|nr:class I SAM-dependent methyltransferase [Anaerolineales bacterium]